MADYFVTAVAVGLAVASVNGYFKWRDTDLTRALRAFLAWMLAFVAAGIAAPSIVEWLLTSVF